jgi:dGTPase
MEAADDICYQVMDIEDAHKLKILGIEEVTTLLTGFFNPERCRHITGVLDNIDDDNEKVAYLRSCVVGELVGECAKVFVDNEECILNGEFEGCLIDHISPVARNGYAECSRTAWRKIYNSPDVVDIELAGNQIITFLLDRLIDAVLLPEKNYSRLLLSRIPHQYDTSSPTTYGKIQSVLDHISGMTDVYALDLFRKLNGLSLPAV